MRIFLEREFIVPTRRCGGGQESTTAVETLNVFTDGHHAIIYICANHNLKTQLRSVDMLLF